MKLIIGLGNPGKQYEKVRHNLGFMVLDALAKRVKGQGGSWKYEEKFKSEIFNFTLNALPLTLIKPQTYMNNSGMAVKLLNTYYKLQPEDIIVVYDELDLPLGKIKIRIGGAAAGHHGIESIMESLGTDKFIRVRLGIGNETTESAEHGGSHVDVNHYVLSPFNSHEKSKLKHMLKQALGAVDVLLEKGLETAQGQFN